MKKLVLALILTLAIQPLGFSASEWDKEKPAGADDRSDLDTILQVNNEAVDRLVSNYRRGMALSYATVATLTAAIGEVTCSNATGAVRKFRANTTATTITWADIDTGAEANSTTYYVYAVADADATTSTFKISASATTPTGATYYKRLGSFYNNSSGDIENVDSDDAPAELSTAYGAPPSYSCRAWVNFDGTTGTIRSSGNVSSITDNGTGDYTINFTTAMPDANYSSVGTAGGSDSMTSAMSTNYDAAQTTTALRVVVYDYNGTRRDYAHVSIAVFR